MMPLVEFSSRPPATRAGVLLLLAGLAAMALVVVLVWNSRQHAAAWQQRTDAAEQRVQAATDRARAVQAAAQVQVQQLQSDERLRELHRPWGRLFGALEAAQQAEPVKLMFVDPAAAAGTVHIDAQAGGIDTAARYVQALVAAGLAEAAITQHRAAFGEGAAPGVVFTVTGRWHEGR